MEMSLYYPGSGYCTSSGDKKGTEGEYCTSPNLTPSFGAMIGRQFEEMWETMEKQPFIAVEYGTGTGKLCCDILDYLKSNVELYENEILHHRKKPGDARKGTDPAA